LILREILHDRDLAIVADGFLSTERRPQPAGKGGMSSRLAHSSRPRLGSAIGATLQVWRYGDQRYALPQRHPDIRSLIS